MYNIVDTLSTTAPYSLMGQVGILSIYYVDTTYSNMYNINGTILTDTQKSPLYKKKKEHASVLFEKGNNPWQQYRKHATELALFVAGQQR